MSTDKYIIETPRLILRPAVESDAEAYHKLKTDPANFLFDPFNPDVSLEDVQQLIAKLHAKTAKDEMAFLVFTLRDTGEVIGYGGYSNFEHVEPLEFLSKPSLPSGPKLMTDFGITIDNAHRRKGYAFEIFAAHMDYAVHKFGCELFLLETAIKNEPWRGLMRSAFLSEFENRNYDEDEEEIWEYKFDAKQWDEAKEKITAAGKWPL